MPTIITGVILITATAALIILLLCINRQYSNKRMKELMNTFTEAATQQGFNFSSNEVLKDKIIGLDGKDKRLLVFDFLHKESTTTIRLSDIKECALQKEYMDVNYGSEKKADVEKTLRKIALQLRFKKPVEAISLSFYDNTLHTVYEMKELESKAKNWEMAISKMLHKETAAIS